MSLTESVVVASVGTFCRTALEQHGHNDEHTNSERYGSKPNVQHKEKGDKLQQEGAGTSLTESVVFFFVAPLLSSTTMTMNTQIQRGKGASRMYNTRKKEISPSKRQPE